MRPGTTRSGWMIVAAALALLASLPAQNGDRKGEKQPGLPKDLMVPAAPPLTPEQGLASLKVAPGYRVELVAAEPLVVDPVVIRFDAKGRMWAVEMRGYMPNVDGTGEDAPVGKIVILEDEDGDGRMDKSTVWLDGLVLPRALFLYEDGALVVSPPTMKFWQDTDGDGKADTSTEVASGFSVEAVEHTGNGLVWAPDGWLHLAKHPRRIRRIFGDGQIRFEEESHPFIGQWGISRTDDGRLLYNYNPSYLHGDLFHAAYADRNPHHGRAAGCNVRMDGNQTVFPGRINPGVNRGYRKGTLRPDYRLAKFTAACSPELYRGHLMPKATGDVFVCEPSGNLVRRSKIVDRDLEFSAKIATEGREFLVSTDERFRPVSLHTGPDGALYVVDLYRGILQHREYVTSFLRKQILDRGLDKPVGLGRIYRVVPDRAAPVPPPTNVAEMDAANLVSSLDDPNGWVRDMAQRLLVERRDPEARGYLVAMVQSPEASGRARALALWGMHHCGWLRRSLLFDALRAEDEDLVRAALRVSESRIPDDPFVRAAAVAAGKKHGPRTSLQAVLSLGESSEFESMIQVLGNDPDHYPRQAALTGLHGRELEFVQRLLLDDAWSESTKNRITTFRMLARCVGKERKGARLLAMLGIVGTGAPWQQEALLQGLLDALPKGKKRQGFYKLPEPPKAMAALLESEAKPVAKKAEDLRRSLAWGPEAVDPPLPPEVKAAFAKGRGVYARTCANCHQRNGQGLDGLAPPLVGSSWVTDDPDVLIKIVLNGIDGPIQVGDKTWDKAMEAHGFLKDDEIADVATFVRLAWDNGGEPVSVDKVKAVRKAVGERTRPYTAGELR